MTREEKCKALIDIGYTYNPKTGDIYSRFGKIIKAKTNKGYIYIGTIINKKYYNLLAHHFAWYNIYGNCNTDQIDHINGIPNDNRICNLRNVNQNKNQWNRKAAKGYYLNKDVNKYVSQIAVNKRIIYLGIYSSEQEARQAYLNAKEKYHII